MNKDLEKAQAFLEKFEEQNQPEATPIQEATVEVVESANPQPQAIPIVEPVVEEVVPVPQVVVSQVTDGQIEALTAKIEKVENAYKSLQGKYNKELPDARNDSARLLAENNSLKIQLMNGQAPQVGTPQVESVGLKERLGQEKVDELGENYVDVIDEATQALANQQAEFAKKQESLQEQMVNDRFARYEESVASQVVNFASLVNPYGDGKLDAEFSKFLTDRYMFPAFDEADSNMNVGVVTSICKMFNDSKVPVAPVAPVVAPAPVQLHNPKTQAIAPQTTNTATPQMQASQATYAYKVSDYIANSRLLATGKMKASQWMAFESNYNQAVAEGKVNLTA